MEEKKKNAHQGHRKRLKNKVKNFGLECLEYHEILELLLTYTIPRADTNPTAHNLMNNFGSFCDVIDADYYDLIKVDGIGPESALLFNILSSLMEVYNKSKQERKAHILNGPGACAKFFRTFYPIKANEYMLLVCLSANKKVLKTYKFKGHDDTSVSFNLKTVINNISVSGANSVVLFHTHPNGRVEPSAQDIITTQNLLNACLTNGIDFEDHIILNEDEYFSFNKNAIINKMKAKYISVFSSTAGYLPNIDKEKIENDDK